MATRLEAVDVGVARAGDMGLHQGSEGHEVSLLEQGQQATVLLEAARMPARQLAPTDGCAAWRSWSPRWGRQAACIYGLPQCSNKGLMQPRVGTAIAHRVRALAGGAPSRRSAICRSAAIVPAIMVACPSSAALGSMMQRNSQSRREVGLARLEHIAAPLRRHHHQAEQLQLVQSLAHGRSADAERVARDSSGIISPSMNSPSMMASRRRAATVWPMKLGCRS